MYLYQLSCEVVQIPDFACGEVRLAVEEGTERRIEVCYRPLRVEFAPLCLV